MNHAATEGNSIERIGFPSPPHRILGSRSKGLLVVGYAAMALLFAIGVGLLIAYFGFNQVGRGLVVDSLLATGIGTPLPGAAVELGDCEYHGSRAGSKVPSSWRCDATVIADGQRTERPFETNSKVEHPQPLGAGRVFGKVGIYWPVGMLLARWWSILLLPMIGGGLIAIAVATFRWSFATRRLMRARHGQVQDVDLLTGQGRVWFAFVGEDGVRRFQRADTAAEPLMLDSLRTIGVAIVAGDTAVLLALNLVPLEVDATRRETIYTKVAEVQRQSQVRRALAPLPGDPPTLAGRIEAIDQRLKGRLDPAALGRLYDAVWRLIWDGNDAGIAQRALVARDAIALRLGPEATWAALDACRRQHGSAAH